MTFGCDLLSKAHVSENNSGIKFNPNGKNMVFTTSKDVIDICLNCPYDECLVVERAREKESRGLAVR